MSARPRPVDSRVATTASTTNTVPLSPTATSPQANNNTPTSSPVHNNQNGNDSSGNNHSGIIVGVVVGVVIFLGVVGIVFYRKLKKSGVGAGAKGLTGGVGLTADNGVAGTSTQESSSTKESSNLPQLAVAGVPPPPSVISPITVISNSAPASGVTDSTSVDTESNTNKIHPAPTMLIPPPRKSTLLLLPSEYNDNGNVDQTVRSSVVLSEILAGGIGHGGNEGSVGTEGNGIRNVVDEIDKDVVGYFVNTNSSELTVDTVQDGVDVSRGNAQFPLQDYKNPRITSTISDSALTNVTNTFTANTSTIETTTTTTTINNTNVTSSMSTLISTPHNIDPPPAFEDIDQVNISEVTPPNTSTHQPDPEPVTTSTTSIESHLLTLYGSHLYWTTSQVLHWVTLKTLPMEIYTKFSMHQIDGGILHSLCNDDLKDDLGVLDFVVRARVLKEVEILRRIERGVYGGVVGAGRGRLDVDVGAREGEVELPPSYVDF
ncbi:hypothetical protein HDU76_000478 [Blyttiomyces sp. JEL0837]|nr:hypothetical protein HDU76_000478 [Blyttiomyces sp. JEL0837]